MRTRIWAILALLITLTAAIPAEAQVRKIPITTEYLLFQRGSENPQVFVKNRTTGIETQLTNQGRNFAPTLCDDGTVVYASTMEGPLEVYRRPISGGFAVRLTTPSQNMADLPRSCRYGIVLFSRVSYDEAQYQLGLITKPSPEKRADVIASSGIYKVPLAGGDTIQFKSGTGLYEPAFSLDATKVAIAVQNQQTGQFSVKVYSSSTGMLLHETMTTEELRFPAWINEDQFLVQVGPIANARIGIYTISTQALSIDTTTGWAGRPFIIGGDKNITIGYDNMANIETLSALQSTGAPITSVGNATSYGSWVKLPDTKKPPVETR